MIQLECDGYEVRNDFLAPGEIAELREAFPASSIKGAGARDILGVPAVRKLSSDLRVREIVEAVLGLSARPVRGIFFDKTPETNWSAPWHQDLTIAVRERVDVPGFGPWSSKAGIVHVQPPAEVLESMVTLRFHLDPCPTGNGALRVVPGSHRAGKIPEREIDAAVARGGVEACPVALGGVLLMRPLILHTSSPSSVPGHRRVVHIEFAAGDLPDGLRWREG